MKVPLSWLREYVDVELPARELAHRLTMAGIEAGDIVELGGWNNCYVGKVLETRPHPNADRLTLCRVNIGAEELEVVCGAPNVAAGQKICFA
jgi:phenylalanyl-tRNA synthetase beta chain